MKREKSKSARSRFGLWPTYSAACRRDMDRLLRAGGSLSAYRGNPTFPIGPVGRSWAWRFERDAERMLGVRHVAACANGTLALMAAITALGLKPGGTIITTPYTFSADAAAIRLTGHEPVFADVDPATFCLDPKSVAEVVDGDTRAILAVDLFGRTADYVRLRDFNLPIIEDACQAVGAASEWGAPAGTLGDIAVWSFNGAKNIPAGEAGAVVGNATEVMRLARGYLNHVENWPEASVGLNGRLNEPTALIAWHGLRALKERNRARRRLARALVRELANALGIAVLPNVVGPAVHALYCFPLVLAKGVDRARFAENLKRAGVEVNCGYLTPHIADYPAFKDCRRAPLPVVTELSERSLCLFTQVRPPATAADMRWLGKQIRAALA